MGSPARRGGIYYREEREERRRRFDINNTCTPAIPNWFIDL
jgi:hypothetical protein